MPRPVRLIILALLAAMLPLATWTAEAATGQEVLLTLTGPDEVAPEADITVSGTVTDNDGRPMRHVDVKVVRRCIDPWEPGLTTVGVVSTDNAGGFAVSSAAGACNGYLFRADHDVDPSQSVSAEHTVRVARVYPTLRMDAPATAVAGDSVPVSISLTMPDGAPVPDAEVEFGLTRPDGTELRRVVRTGADGTVVVVDTLTLEGPHDYRVYYAGSPTLSWTAGNNQTVTVSKLPTSLTMAGPETAALDEPFTLSGTVSGPESPVDLTLSEPDGTTRTVTSRPDGSYEVEVSSTTGGSPRWLIQYPGDVRYAGAGASHRVTVPKVQTELTASGPANVRLYEDFTITGRLSGVDAPAEIRLEGPYPFYVPSRTFMTQADGSFEVSTSAYYPMMPGTHTWKLTYSGDSRHTGSATSYDIEVLPVRTSISLEGPATAPLDTPIKLTGHLTGAPNPTRVLVTDPLGYTRSTETAADGSFEYLASPQNVSGPATWSVTYDDDPRYERASARATVSIEPLRPTVRVRTDRLTYTARQRAGVHVTVNGAEDQPLVIVTATRQGRAPEVLFRGIYPEDGLALNREMTFTERIKAVVPESDRQVRTAAEVKRGVRLALTTRALQRLTTSGRYAVYARSADPLFETKSYPRRPGSCLRHQVQRYRNGAWATALTSVCKDLSNQGEVRWRLRGSQTARVPYRVRALFAGDRQNIASHGRWAYFRFR